MKTLNPHKVIIKLHIITYNASCVLILNSKLNSTTYSVRIIHTVHHLNIM